jgi:hypothetical protein
MNFIKKMIQGWKDDMEANKVKPLGESVKELYNFMDNNPSLISSFTEINPSIVFVQKLEKKDNPNFNTFILKLKVKEDIFQLEFPINFIREYEADDYYSYQPAKVSVLSSPHVVKISDNLVPNFLKELDVETLVTKSINDLHKLKEAQDLEILNKIRVRP